MLAKNCIAPLPVSVINQWLMLS